MSKAKPITMHTKITRTEMLALIYAARIVFWQTAIANGASDAVKLVARLGIEASMHNLSSTGITPQQLTDIADRVHDELMAATGEPS